MARIRFRFVHEYAKTLAVAGDFNGWSASSHPMNRGRDGVWTVEVKLLPGRHEYKFVVNGKEWWNDPSAPKVANIWGTENSYVDVPAK
jgi:1,4-alpha-glucan branching enzyme